MAVLLAALGETMVHAIHALAQAALRHQALIAVQAETISATTLARRAIARAISAGADPRTVEPEPPPPTSTCRLRGSHGCAIEGRATISFQPPVIESPETPPPCPSAACTVYEQENDAVSEGRVETTIAAQATAAGGALLAARVVRVTFRTLKIAPYAALSGGADATLAIAAAVPGPGDDGGAAPNGAAPGTLIDVLYENASTGATFPANVWRSQVQSRKPHPSPWSP